MSNTKVFVHEMTAIIPRDQVLSLEWIARYEPELHDGVLRGMERGEESGCAKSFSMRKLWSWMIVRPEDTLRINLWCSGEHYKFEMLNRWEFFYGDSPKPSIEFDGRPWNHEYIIGREIDDGMYCGTFTDDESREWFWTAHFA